MPAIAANIARVRQHLAPHVTLIAVSKTYGAESIMAAYGAGQRDFGENRPQELLRKAAELPQDIRWHFIGHLQSNKVKMVAPCAHLIHSIDSAKLLHEVNRVCETLRLTARCLLQVHVAQEETKFGFLPDELLSYLRSGAANALRSVQLCGLMGMASNTDDMGQVRREFRLIKQLHGQAREITNRPDIFTHISMGMSGDYAVAIEEGATMVRIGSLIFGEREAARPEGR
ncbi:MAG: YggS family pyridoxal phosphate-dependent enzyme [Prevotellaceae bacterium]|jgi:pyridoxal phosphate enzyme (YggS family)|nr:YggS family pyridoxal phosphate-dependent enzyme [Prevotellaceae bacterium]